MSGIEALRWAQLYPDDVSAIIGNDMCTPTLVGVGDGNLNGEGAGCSVHCGVNQGYFTLELLAGEDIYTNLNGSTQFNCCIKLLRDAYGHFQAVDLHHLEDRLVAKQVACLVVTSGNNTANGREQFDVLLE